MESLTFGINTAKDKYEEFLEEYDEYIQDETSTKKAKNLFTTAWHLADWAFHDYGVPNGTTNFGEFRETLYTSCQSLKIMHDLTNASKHKNLDRPKANLKATRKRIGPFSSEFNRVFEKTYLEIELVNNQKLRFKDEIAKVKSFWENYFIDK